MYSDDDQTRDVFAHFGLAYYLAQCLEHGVVNAFVALRLPEKEQITRAEIVDFENGRFKKTLGVLIKELLLRAPQDQELEHVLGAALARRNTLAHGYFRSRANEFATCDGRSLMIDELKSDQSLFEEADRLLTEAMAPIRRAGGISDEDIDRAYREICNDFRVAP